ncbi:MAG: 50S ribosomal protein L3 N(5)-glutamine methyltransferase [Gammaproteobacteria bacterium]|nr:50S ribosomal protein L3 N(5)-glutamine methyltransferase [Gammaproteobacteria bacterium]
MKADDIQTTPTTIAGALDLCTDALEKGEVYFGHGTDNAWDEAVHLVLSVAQVPLDAGEEVLQHPLSAAQFAQVESLLEKRIADHVPLPYLLGRAWFAGLEFICDERAIIPRSPIAELIIDNFQPWYSGPEPQRVLDLCCGGGCIGLAAAYYQPQIVVDLLDLDADALALATENTRKLGLDARVRLLQSNGLAALQDECYDIILCNPPYVDACELARMPREFSREPELALGSGADGLALTRELLAQVGQYLAPHGLLVLEVGASWPALEAAYPRFPFTWVELVNGGEGVCVISAREWQDYSASGMR